MVVFPPAKINLGLNVVRRRSDGYHDIETVMLPIPLHDVLEVAIDADAPTGSVRLYRTGLPVPGEPTSDLCYKAAIALGAEHRLPGLHIHLHKVIPMGAGLGGGSSDGAHVLRTVRAMLGLPITAEGLAAIAASLGSDVPFFLQDGPCIVEGRGELLRPVTLALENWWILLVNPGSHVSTAGVYANTQPTGTPWDLAHVLSTTPVEHWQARVRNVMEAYVFSQHPEVAEARARLMDAGAAFASMSGSGSSVFGLFRAPPPALEWPPAHRAWSLQLRV